jgi:hypothetical protein
MRLANYVADAGEEKSIEDFLWEKQKERDD